MSSSSHVSSSYGSSESYFSFSSEQGNSDPIQPQGSLVTIQYQGSSQTHDNKKNFQLSPLESFADEVLLHIFSYAVSDQFVCGKLRRVCKRFKTFVEGENEFWIPRSVSLKQRVRFLSQFGPFAQGHSNYEITRHIALLEKLDFMVMMQRISSLLLGQEYSLTNLVTSSGNVHSPDLFQQLWLDIGKVDMTPLICYLIQLDLNEAILFLTFSPKCEKDQVTKALMGQITLIGQTNMALANFYLGMVIKGHLIDFSARPIPLFELSTLFRFVLQSRVKDLKFSDFQACGLDFWKNDKTSAINDIIKNIGFLRNSYLHNGPSGMSLFNVILYQSALTGCLASHIKTEPMSLMNNQIAIFGNFLTHLNEPEDSDIYLQIVHLLNMCNLVDFPPMAEIVKKLPQRLISQNKQQLEEEFLMSLTGQLSS